MSISERKYHIQQFVDDRLALPRKDITDEERLIILDQMLLGGSIKMYGIITDGDDEDEAKKKITNSDSEDEDDDMDIMPTYEVTTHDRIAAFNSILKAGKLMQDRIQGKIQLANQGVMKKLDFGDLTK